MEKLNKFLVLVGIQILVATFAFNGVAGPDANPKVTKESEEEVEAVDIKNEKLKKPGDESAAKEKQIIEPLTPKPATKIPLEKSEVVMPPPKAIQETKPVSAQEVEAAESILEEAPQPLVPVEPAQLPVDIAGTQTSKLDQAQQKSPCDDLAVQNIVKVLGDSDANVLGLMYEITALRLARQARLETKTNKTLEDAVAHQLGDLKEKMTTIKNSQQIQDKLTQIYKDYGMKADLDVLNKFVNKEVKPCYWSCKGSRFLNDHSSAYVLAMTQSEQSVANEFKLSEVDAATIYAVEKIRSTAASTDKAYLPGTEKGNLMQISNRVARYLGAISGGESLSAEELEMRITADSAVVRSMINEAFLEALKAYEDCLKLQHPDCPACVTQAKASFEAGMFEKVFKELLKKVSATDSASLKNLKGLKGVANEVKFDFTNFSKGGVPAYKCLKPMQRDPCAPHKMIACKDYSKTGVTASQYSKLVYEKRFEEVKKLDTKVQSTSNVPTNTGAPVTPSGAAASEETVLSQPVKTNIVAPPVDQVAAEKPAAEKPAAEKLAAEKPAAEKPAAEKPNSKIGLSLDQQAAAQKSREKSPFFKAPATSNKKSYNYLKQDLNINANDSLNRIKNMTKDLEKSKKIECPENQKDSSGNCPAEEPGKPVN